MRLDGSACAWIRLDPEVDPESKDTPHGPKIVRGAEPRVLKDLAHDAGTPG